MDFTDEQISTLKESAENGAQLNELQSIIQDTFGKSITYMETRFLISDLGIEISSQTPETESAVPSTDFSVNSEPSINLEEQGLHNEDTDLHNEEEILDSGVSISIDDSPEPGTLLSGTVIWSDGEKAQWLIDETGGLDMKTEDPNYQPSNSDIESFQTNLREMIDKLK